MGLLLFVLQELPYLVMPLFRMESNPIMNMRESSVILNICEKIIGIGCVLLTIFLVQKDAELFSLGSGPDKIGFIAAVAALLLYYAGWILYFSGHQSIAVMMLFLVMMPPLYYACIGIWRHNRILTGSGILFLFIHFIHVWKNLHLS